MDFGGRKSSKLLGPVKRVVAMQVIVYVFRENCMGFYHHNHMYASLPEHTSSMTMCGFTIFKIFIDGCLKSKRCCKSSHLQSKPSYPIALVTHTLHRFFKLPS